MKNSLQAVLDRQVKTEAAPTAPVRPAVHPEPGREKPSRVGKRLIAGHFDAHVAKQLRILAAEEETTIQALLGEALDLLFVKKGRGRVVSG